MEEPTKAVLCGISKEKGLEHYQIFDFSVNKWKFKEYCENLRAKNEGQQIALFMDNLSAHVCGVAKDAMKDNGFRYITNVPYSPEYNPIELTFSMLKKNFKALRAQKLLGLRQESHEALVALAVK